MVFSADDQTLGLLEMVPAPVAANIVDDSTAGEEEAARTFHHARNKTGIVGGQGKQWHGDAAVNALWMKLSEPEGNDPASLQNSFVRHVLTTLARTYFNIDNFAGYQATAHTYLHDEPRDFLITLFLGFAIV